MVSFVEKYSPKKVADIVGQKDSIMDIIHFLDNFKEQKKKALILHGPTGSGKSSCVYAIANDFNYDIIELNASDIRNKEMIEKTLKNAVKTGSIFGKKKMVFIDEVESFSSKDRGGIAALIKVIKETKIPILMIALDIWDQKIRTLKSYCHSVEFKKVHYASINKHMKTLLEYEGIEFEPEITAFIAKNAGGDLRAAINDLEIISAGKKKITKEDLMFIEDRPKEDKIFNAIQKIFKTQSLSEAREVFNTVNMDFNLFSLWVSDNIVNEYEKPHEIARAYDFASRSDVFSGRIRRRQSWNLYKYSIDLMTAGVSSSKDERYNKFTRYNPPTKITRLYQTKSKRVMKQKICRKLGQRLHASSKKIEQHYLPYLKTILKSRKIAANIAEHLELEKEDISFLRKGM